ncbi:MerR family transcriptional regulator [Enterococcus sp. AZ109]|uniref:MerR family transcriptional regulator n=1 Tax=Enterococcus sp. AZ109 TaxID=2774634 RepID=UPI003F270B0F
MNIATVSKKFGIATDTIRYYEKAGLIPPITRDGKGYRVFSENDLNWVYFAKVMRNAGVSVEAIVEYVSLFLQGREETIDARKVLLIKQREVLENKVKDINETLQYLTYKIEDNSQHLLNFEKLLEDGYLAENSEMVK